MDRTLLLLLLSFLLVSAKQKDSEGGEDRGEGTNRKSKVLPVFQLITFKNDPCVGNSNNNGTCYTLAECTAKGGVSSGSTCASGYGICCIFTLSCGGSSSQNCTYLVQASTTKAPTTNPCTYTICRCSTNICRIRLDFTTFQIASPITGTTVPSSGTTLSTTGGGIGDCATDTFSFTSPGSGGSPIICGYNTGQHMIVDASDSCSIASFNIGSSGDTRQWNIKVTQYECGDSQGGPEGCLQYFTGISGRVSNFNFPTASSTVGASTTHLSSQCYTMCFRQEESKCSICFTPSIVGTPVTPTEVATAQTSFGLSNPTGTIAVSAVDDACTSDFLIIPNATPIPATATSSNIVNRICGRAFTQATNSMSTSVSVCSYAKPFQIQFKTDANEVTTSTAANMANNNEQNSAPGGIVGFSLNYVEQAC